MAKKSTEETATAHKVLSPITFGELDAKGARKDVSVAPGEEIDLTPSEAAPLIAAGVVEPKSAKAEKAKA